MSAKNRSASRPSAVRIPRYTLLLALPAVALYCFALLVPAVRGSLYAFTDWTGLGNGFSFVGFSNFIKLFQTPDALHALVITLILAAVITVCRTVVGLLLALGVNSQIKSKYVLRVVFFTPVVITPVVAAYLFQFLLAPNGPLNRMLESLLGAGATVDWLGAPTPALISIVILMTWRGAGYSMVIFLAGLQNIPVEVDEAAAIDGASPYRKFRSVTLPLLAPATTISVMLALLDGFAVFGEVWILTNGGPGTATETLSTSLYRNAFLLGNYGLAIAEAAVLFVLAAVASSLQYGYLVRAEGRS